MLFRSQTITDADAKLQLGAEFARIQTALKEAQQRAAAQKKTDDKIAALRKQMAAAEESGDVAAQVQIATKLKALGVQETREPMAQPELPGMQMNFFAPREMQKRKEAYETRQAAALEESRPDLAAPVSETDPLAMWKASLDQSEQQTRDELLNFNWERALTPTQAPTVKVADNIQPVQNAPTLLRRIDELVDTRDRAAKDAQAAISAGNRELASQKYQEQEAAQTSLNQIENTEGPAKALVALRKAQDTALTNTASLADDLRLGFTLSKTRNQLDAATAQFNAVEQQIAALSVAPENETKVAGSARLNAIQELRMQRDALDRKSTRLNSSHSQQSRMPSSA